MHYRVRDAYVVHLGKGNVVKGGEVFEPTPKVLQEQGWKIEPVNGEPKPDKTKAPDSAPAPETKEVPEPPKDRTMKKDGPQTK
jgi:hypothetical protein